MAIDAEMTERDHHEARARTAMSRSGLSRPIAIALDDGVIGSSTSVLDYGCGRGGDVARLRDRGLPVHGWDPVHAPQDEPRPADIVNLGYVVNVIENAAERAHVLTQAWGFARRTLVVAARPEWEARTLNARPAGDGWRTTKGTFQKFYSQDELRTWIDITLGVRSVAAAPGIFYVFRDEREAQQLLASRVRGRTAVPWQRISEALFETHRDLLQPLADYLADRGRLPHADELAHGAELAEAFGSVRAAAAVLRRLLDTKAWEQAQERATKDLLVYLALSAFQRRARWSHLPDGLQRDIKAFFGSYRAATAAADRLLYAVADPRELDDAIGTLTFGKVLPDALYVHAAYLNRLPPILRVYEGCARVLVGSVPDATIIKLQRVNRRVAYLCYPDFERDPHPALAWSLRADLRTLDVKWRDFRRAENPPVLHRKDAFVPDEHPSRSKFRRLTAQEERAELLGSTTIGTRLGWEQALVAAGWRLAGHRLVGMHEAKPVGANPGR